MEPPLLVHLVGVELLFELLNGLCTGNFRRDADAAEAHPFRCCVVFLLSISQLHVKELQPPAPELTADQTR
jgi:hypothetical protein